MLDQLTSSGLSSVIAERSRGLSHLKPYPNFSAEFDYFLRPDLQDPSTVLGAAYRAAIITR